MAHQQSPYESPEVVGVYDRLAVPLQFAAPARDLVAALNLTAGQRVLDVGTGTGAALAPAALSVGAGGFAVGIDASIEMLRVNRGRSRACVVAADAFDLPFPTSFFDAALASFVVAHLNTYSRAIAEMVRVVRPGGHLGITAWGSAPNAFADVWNHVVSAFVSLEELKRGFKAMVPWNEWFAEEANLRKALSEAGLSNVEIARHDYAVSASTTDYLLLRELSLRGHVVKGRIGPERWAEFNRDVSAAFRSRFGEQIRYVEDVHIAVGTKP